MDSTSTRHGSEAVGARCYGPITIPSTSQTSRAASIGGSDSAPAATPDALYDNQVFNFAGAYGNNGRLEDHTAHVRGEPIGCAVLATSNAAGQTQHVAANYRPRSSLLLVSRLVGEKLAATPYAKYFVASES